MVGLSADTGWAEVAVGSQAWSRERLMTDSERPAHPTRQAVLLLVGVTLLIVALAVISSWSAL